MRPKKMELLAKVEDAGLRSEYHVLMVSHVAVVYFVVL